VRQVGGIQRNPSDLSQLFVGTILDISAIKQSEIFERDRLARIELCQEALLEWSRVDYEKPGESYFIIA